MTASNTNDLVLSIIKAIKDDNKIDHTDPAALRPLIRQRLMQARPDLEMITLMNLEDAILSKTVTVKVSLNKEA